ncbi:eukaryotic translation initiation factor 2C, 3 [Actinomortierella ambigua]|nr:eukaryotic translation initiation factor 2C, 3 [Actinomortierella ambigua]
MEVAPNVRRPGYGTKGTRTEVLSNFFPVTKLPDVLVYHYDITITPDVPPTVNRKVFSGLETEYLASDFNNVRPFFDGRRNMYTPKELPFEQRILDVLDPGPRRKDREGRPIVNMFKVRIKLVSRVNLFELNEFMRGRVSLSNNILTSITALDILIRHKPAMLYPSIGRCFYVPDTIVPISGGLEVWQGYYQSARPTKDRMMICVDISGSAFYPSGPLLTFVLKILNMTLDDMRRPIAVERLSRVERLLKGLRITVTHREKLARSYKILRLSRSGARDTTFDLTKPFPGAVPDEAGHYKPKDVEHVPTSVLNYFKEKYDITIKYPYLPCVAVSQTSWIPLELCNLVAGQRYVRKLDDRQTADMLKFMGLNPTDRANRIRKGVQLLNYEGNEYIREFGMEIDTNMVKVKARVLPTPTLRYHESSNQNGIVPKDGTWNLRASKMFVGSTLTSWGVIAFGNDREMPMAQIQPFLRELDSVFSASGVNVQTKSPPTRYCNQQGDIELDFQTFFQEVGNQFKVRPQLFLVLLPNRGVPLYAEVKRISDTVIGLTTQCVQYAHVQRPNRQVLANICLKVNVKLGGTNAIIPTDMMVRLDKPTIILGADVTHPAPGETNKPSIATVVGSLDRYAARYAAAIRIQSPKTELIADMEGMMIDLLKTFFQSTGHKPQQILFYRDGVSESQFEEVKKSEVAAIKNACQRLEKDYQPKLTFVVIQKRHHARLFPVRPKDMDRSGNCKAGTVVDEGIIHPTEFDFYLQSQAGLLGTSRPTHYHVLLDEMVFTADELQVLSYNLCHLYARCTRTVSLVPSAYYAHLVAARARFHSRAERFAGTASGSEPGSREPDIDTMIKSFGNLHGVLMKSMWFM